MAFTCESALRAYMCAWDCLCVAHAYARVLRVYLCLDVFLCGIYVCMCVPVCDLCVCMCVWMCVTACGLCVCLCYTCVCVCLCVAYTFVRLPMYMCVVYGGN